MKHLKPVNRKAKAIGKDSGDPPVVEAQGTIPFMHTCTSVFNPGYEIDFTNGMTQLCTPIETDLFGTTDMFCWWPGQAPDTINNPDWNADCTRAMKDWMKLKVVKPEW
jgi:hypothetical protein